MDAPSAVRLSLHWFGRMAPYRTPDPFYWITPKSSRTVGASAPRTGRGERCSADGERTGQAGISVSCKIEMEQFPCKSGSVPFGTAFPWKRLFEVEMVRDGEGWRDGRFMKGGRTGKVGEAVEGMGWGDDGCERVG